MNTPSSHRDRTIGLWLGVLGVAIFAVTLPATRLATGTSEQPQLSPWFVTVGRAALAGLLSAVFLLATRSPRPQPQQWRHLGWAVLGNALGYPLLLAFALRSVTASHAAVVTALLPLVTAAVAALVLHQRARLGFWLFAVLGSLLVVATTATAKPRVTRSSDSPSSRAAARMERKGCSSCVWLTRRAPPRASPRYQAKKPAHIENTPTYRKPPQAEGATGWLGHSHSVAGRETGSAIRHTQQITRSAPSAGVMRAPWM